VDAGSADSCNSAAGNVLTPLTAQTHWSDEPRRKGWILGLFIPFQIIKDVLGHPAKSSVDQPVSRDDKAGSLEQQVDRVVASEIPQPRISMTPDAQWRAFLTRERMTAAPAQLASVLADLERFLLPLPQLEAADANWSWKPRTGWIPGVG
jgi:hypothetical protein